MDSEYDIRIGSENPTAHVAGRNVYFPFASGRFAYDCVGCGAMCCRGHGYLVQPGQELDAQLAIAPTVRFFMSPCDAGTAHYHVANAAPACFFLDGNNRCRVHAASGFAAKPETCRLFPFNSIVRLGEFLLVGPHPSLCPLRVLPRGASSDQSSHTQLLGELAARGVNNHVEALSYRSGDPADTIRREREIVALSEEYLESGDYVHFAAAQLGAAKAGRDSRTADTWESDIRECVRLIHVVLQVDESTEARPGDGLVRTIVAMTPMLRMEHLLIAKDGSARVGHDRIPYLLTALATFARFAVQAGMEGLSFQGVHSMMRENLSLLTLLSMLNRHVTWASDSDIDVSFKGDERSQQTYRTLARRLLPDTPRARVRLGDLLAEHVPYTGPERVMFLKRFAKHTAGRLAVLGDMQPERPSTSQWPRSLDPRQLFRGRAAVAGSLTH